MPYNLSLKWHLFFKIYFHAIPSFVKLKFMTWSFMKVGNIACNFFLSSFFRNGRENHFEGIEIRRDKRYNKIAGVSMNFSLSLSFYYDFITARIDNDIIMKLFTLTSHLYKVWWVNLHWLNKKNIIHQQKFARSKYFFPASRMKWREKFVTVIHYSKSVITELSFSM